MRLLILPGVALILLVWLDVVRTVLLPSSRGPVSYAVYRTLWRLVRSGGDGPVRRRATQFVGPGSVALTIVLWLGLLWVGFALIYWALIDDVTFSPDIRFGGRGPVEALYLSGTALTTLGLGDVSGASDLTRLLTVLEAASGLGIFTATISFLPTIYTLVSELRGSALAAADLEAADADGAAHLAVHGGETIVETLRRDVVATREHYLRFPVLFYFHPPVEESPLALARNAAGLAATLRWALDGERSPHSARVGAVLEASLRRLLDELERHVGTLEPGDPAGSAHHRIEATRRAVAAIDRDAAAAGTVPDAAAEFLERADSVLGAMARMHGYACAPILGEGSRVDADRPG